MSSLLARLLAGWRQRRDVRATIRRLRALEREGLFVAATAVAGKIGKVVVAAATVAEIDGWDYNPTADMIEKTPFLATSKSHLVGLMDGSGSFKGRLDLTDTNGQVVLRNAMLAGTQVTLKLYTTGTNFFTIPALLKGSPMKSTVQGAVEAQYDFQQDGDATYT